MTSYYQGKSVFITGASSGIGSEVALQLAAEGARVAICARRLDRLDSLQAKIKAAGGEAIALTCDVRDRASLDAAAAAAAQAFGGIDIVIANAGFGVAGAFEALTTADFRRQFDTNVFGVIDTAYAVLPYLLKSKGQLAMVSSVLGRIGMASTSPYCSSKFAVYGFAESLFYELSSKGVAVCCILPGVVASEIRSVDNTGVYHAKKKDPAPDWLIVPTETAAREIVRRLPARGFELTITGHGKLIVWLNRRFPRSFRALGRYMAGRSIDPLEKGKRAVPPKP